VASSCPSSPPFCDAVVSGMRDLLAFLVLVQALTTGVWAYPTYDAQSQDAVVRPVQSQNLACTVFERRQDEGSISVAAITVPRVLYPTGFNGFDTEPTLTDSGVSTTLAAASLPQTSMISALDTASPRSSNGIPSSLPASTSTENSQPSAANGSGDDGTTRAIAIVVPIALGTILTLAFGGALMMWCKSKPSNADEHDSQFEIVKENP